MHYMLEEEMAQTTSRYFQSGVFNYLKFFKQTAGETAIKMNGIGLMSLVVNSEPSNLQGLTVKYGKEKAEAMLKLIEKYDTEIDSRQNLEFAVPLDISVGLVAKGDERSFTLENIISGRAIFVDKLRDPKVTHPFRASDVVAEVNKSLKSDYTSEQLKAFLPPREKYEFNNDDFNSICTSENWKRDSNEYHFDHGQMAKDTYSDKVVGFIISKIKDNSGYLLRVKKKRSGKRQKRKS